MSPRRPPTRRQLHALAEENRRRARKQPEKLRARARAEIDPLIVFVTMLRPWESLIGGGLSEKQAAAVLYHGITSATAAEASRNLARMGVKTSLNGGGEASLLKQLRRERARWRAFKARMEEADPSRR